MQKAPWSQRPVNWKLDRSWSWPLPQSQGAVTVSDQWPQCHETAKWIGIRQPVSSLFDSKFLPTVTAFLCYSVERPDSDATVCKGFAGKAPEPVPFASQPWPCAQSWGWFGIRTAGALWSFARAGLGSILLKCYFLAEWTIWSCFLKWCVVLPQQGQYDRASFLRIQDCIPGLTRWGFCVYACTVLDLFSLCFAGEMWWGTAFAGQKADSLLCAGHDGIFLIGSQASRNQKKMVVYCI